MTFTPFFPNLEFQLRDPAVELKNLYFDNKESVGHPYGFFTKNQMQK